MEIGTGRPGDILASSSVKKEDASSVTTLSHPEEREETSSTTCSELPTYKDKQKRRVNGSSSEFGPSSIKSRHMKSKEENEPIILNLSEFWRDKVEAPKNAKAEDVVEAILLTQSSFWHEKVEAAKTEDLVESIPLNRSAFWNEKVKAAKNAKTAKTDLVESIPLNQSSFWRKRKGSGKDEHQGEQDDHGAGQDKSIKLEQSIHGHALQSKTSDEVAVADDLVHNADDGLADRAKMPSEEISAQNDEDPLITWVADGVKQLIEIMDGTNMEASDSFSNEIKQGNYSQAMKMLNSNFEREMGPDQFTQGEKINENTDDMVSATPTTTNPAGGIGMEANISNMTGNVAQIGEIDASVNIGAGGRNVETRVDQNEDIPDRVAEKIKETNGGVYVGDRTIIVNGKSVDPGSVDLQLESQPNPGSEPDPEPKLEPEPDPEPQSEPGQEPESKPVPEPDGGPLPTTILVDVDEDGDDKLPQCETCFVSCMNRYFSVGIWAKSLAAASLVWLIMFTALVIYVDSFDCKDCIITIGGGVYPGIWGPLFHAAVSSFGIMYGNGGDMKCFCCSISAKTLLILFIICCILDHFPASLSISFTFHHDDATLEKRSVIANLWIVNVFFSCFTMFLLLGCLARSFLELFIQRMCCNCGEPEVVIVYMPTAEKPHAIRFAQDHSKKLPSEIVEIPPCSTCSNALSVQDGDEFLCINCDQGLKASGGTKSESNTGAPSEDLHISSVAVMGENIAPISHLDDFSGMTSSPEKSNISFPAENLANSPVKDDSLLAIANLNVSGNIGMSMGESFGTEFPPEVVQIPSPLVEVESINPIPAVNALSDLTDADPNFAMSLPPEDLGIPTSVVDGQILAQGEILSDISEGIDATHDVDIDLPTALQDVPSTSFPQRSLIARLADFKIKSLFT